jgi:hypothetical protein
MHRSNRGHPFISVIALILTAIMIGSWAAWLKAEPALMDQTPRLIYTWSLPASIVFLLITRAIREWEDRR